MVFVWQMLAVEMD